jgi:hypothetical protein
MKFIIVFALVLLSGCGCKNHDDQTVVEYKTVCSDGFETPWVQKLNISRISKIDKKHVIYYIGDTVQFYEIEDSVTCIIVNKKHKGVYNTKEY